MHRGRAAATLLVAAALAAGCHGRGTSDLPAGTDAGLYRVRLDEGDGGKVRKFRLLLWAELPDRLHGEVLSPLGSTELIVDAGDGRLSVLFVRDRVAFAGAADPDALADLIGVRIQLADLVAALLRGEPLPSEPRIVRDPATGDGIPERLELHDPPRGVSLQLKRRRPMRADPESLGRGIPPQGVEVRPLAEIDPEELPGVEVEQAPEGAS